MRLSYFRICEKVSKFSDHHQHKIGAIVVNNGKILSTGFNKMKTHPLSPHPFKSCHAEFMAIKYLSQKDLKNATIYVLRKSRDGKYANAKPCFSCRKLIEDSGIKKIIYTDTNSVKIEELI